MSKIKIQTLTAHKKARQIYIHQSQRQTHISKGNVMMLSLRSVLSHQRWTEIWPEKVAYNDKSLNACKREYTILKRGAWTHVLYEEIWKNIKTSCTLRFRRATFFPNVASRYINIIVHCTECDAQLSITVEMPAANEPVVLKCTIHNVDESLHTGKAKRKLSGDLRTRVSKELWEGQKTSTRMASS